MNLVNVLVVAALLLTPVLVIVALGRIEEVRRRMLALAGSVDGIARGLERTDAPSRIPPPLPRIPEPVIVEREVVAEPEVIVPPVIVAPAPIIAPPVVMEPVVVAPVLVLPPPPLAPRKAAPVATGSLESAIGQKWLVRIGALVLVVGAGFFYAYAVEHGWIGVVQRAISGAVTGLAIVALGVFFNRRGFAALAQGFVGCGAGLLYVDTLASHRLYDLIDAPVALGAMALITAMTAAIALRWSAMPLVLLAQIGGCVAPFLIRGASDRGLASFGYVFLLEAGFLIVAALRRWSLVEVVAAVTTPVMILAVKWFNPGHPPEHVAAWAFAFDLLFLGVATAAAIGRREDLGRRSAAIVALIAAGAAVLASHEIGSSHPKALALAFAGLAIVHAGLAEAVIRRLRGAGEGIEVLRACAGALVLSAAGYWFATATATTAAFSLAGLGLAFAGRLRASIGFRIATSAAFVAAIASVMSLHLHGFASASAGSTPFWNADFGVSVLVVAALAAASFTWKEARWIGLSAASLLLLIVSCAELAWWISAATDDPRYAWGLQIASQVVMVTGAMVGFAAAARRTGRDALLAIFVLLAAFVAVSDGRLIERLQQPSLWLVLNPLCLGALFAPLGLFVAAFLLRGAEGFRRVIARLLAAAAAVLPLVTLSIEALRFFRQHFPPGELLVDAGSAAVSVTWAAYAATLLAIGISKRLRSVRLGALGLLGITLVKVVVSDLSELDELARIASFIALGVVLMAGAWAYHRFAARIFGDQSGARPAGESLRARS